MKYSITENEKFQRALDHFFSNSHKRYNIGTYKESSLHMILKYFVSADGSNHEVDLLGHIADVFINDTVYEIQTGAFNRLKDKLAAFLPEHKVVIIYPICTRKTVCRLDSVSGEIISKRVSPLKKKTCDVFGELVYIKDYLSHKNLSVYLFFYEGEQFKLDEKSIKVGKKKTDKYDTVPNKYIGYETIEGVHDYLGFLPYGLNEEFTLKEFTELSGYRPMTASSILYCMYHSGALVRCGKRGRAYLYKKFNSDEASAT